MFQHIGTLSFISILFPGDSNSKESAYNSGDPGSLPESGRSPEKEVATHSSVLSWRIPGTEEPGIIGEIYQAFYELTPVLLQLVPKN